jgi:lauroyl/myristoyl acyltransferase
MSAPKTVGRHTHGTDARIAAPLFSRDDLSTLALLPFGVLVAWCSPEPCWRYVAQGLARLRHSQATCLRRHIRAVVGPRRLDMPIDVVAEAYLANLPLPKLQTLRLNAPHGWRPRIRLEGREHIEHALADGRGAILWVAPFLFASLVSKIALHQSGFAVANLQRHSHGFSKSRFGVRFLNPLRTRIEGRYVELVVIGPDGSVEGPMKELQHRLAQNGLVWILVGAKGSQVLSAPVFDGLLRVATGVPKLMLRSGATVLPVFAVRSGPSEFVTFVDPPIRAPESLAQPAIATAMIEELGRRLERNIARWPDQFTWSNLIPRSPE